MQTLTNSHYLERCRTFTEYHTLCVNSFLWNTHTPLATTTTTSLPNTPSSTTQHYLTHIHKHHHDTHTLKMNFSLQQDGGEIKNVVLSTIERWMIVEKGTYVDQPKFGHILTPTLTRSNDALRLSKMFCGICLRLFTRWQFTNSYAILTSTKHFK